MPQRVPKATKKAVKKHTKKAPAKIGAKITKIVTTTINKGDESDTIEQEVEVFEVEPAYVMVKAGVTRSLAQYESLRVDVSVSMPCYKEVIEETYEAVADMVSEMLTDEIDQYMEEEG